MEQKTTSKRTPKKRKVDTEVDFYAFARAGKQLQEELVDHKERNKALSIANEQLSGENRIQKTSLIVYDTNCKAKDETIRLLQQDVDQKTAEKYGLTEELEKAKDDIAELHDQNDCLTAENEAYESQIIDKDLELADHRRQAMRFADLTEAYERTKVLLARTQGMHSKATGDLAQARESIDILKNLVKDEPECIFCRSSISEEEFVDSKCKRCSVFYHKTCLRSSISKCPQCQLDWS